MTGRKKLKQILPLKHYEEDRDVVKTEKTQRKKDTRLKTEADNFKE